MSPTRCVCWGHRRKAKAQAPPNTSQRSGTPRRIEWGRPCTRIAHTFTVLPAPIFSGRYGKHGEPVDPQQVSGISYVARPVQEAAILLEHRQPESGTVQRQKPGVKAVLFPGRFNSPASSGCSGTRGGRCSAVHPLGPSGVSELATISRLSSSEPRLVLSLRSCAVALSSLRVGARAKTRRCYRGE